jgi:hypothetical protein
MITDGMDIVLPMAPESGVSSSTEREEFQALTPHGAVVRATLQDRGLAIGGNADNFRKSLPRPPSADAARVARELLPLLMDVLGYDGSTDLAYRLHQESHLRPAHVVTGFGPSVLRTLLATWGLRARPSTDEMHILDVSDLHQQLQLHLLSAPAAER